MTLKAKFAPAYTVTWKNWDGTELEKDENVAYGETPQYNGTTPTRPSDAQYSYTTKTENKQFGTDFAKL